MTLTILIDTLTLFLASYCLVAYLLERKYWVSFIAGTYIIAQTGWTVAFLNGSFWGTLLNNYIWFIFNTAVFSYFIWSGYKK